MFSGVSRKISECFLEFQSFSGGFQEHVRRIWGVSKESHWFREISEVLGWEVPWYFIGVSWGLRESHFTRVTKSFTDLEGFRGFRVFHESFMSLSGTFRRELDPFHGDSGDLRFLVGFYDALVQPPKIPEAYFERLPEVHFKNTFCRSLKLI